MKPQDSLDNILKEDSIDIARSMADNQPMEYLGSFCCSLGDHDSSSGDNFKRKADLEAEISVQEGNNSQNKMSSGLEEENLREKTPSETGDNLENADAEAQGPKEQGAQKKREEKSSPAIEKLLIELEKQVSGDCKLTMIIAFMEQALSQSGTPQFKNFWDARKICMDILAANSNISPSNKAIAWQKYTELSKEARRLKEILDEQSSFAVEQIELAISALEKALQTELDSATDADATEYLFSAKTLNTHRKIYQDLQRELNLLNRQATRINALRKELIRTEMRIRHKNKFFQRLSAIGDQIFPRRKELIKDISQQFAKDVEQFVSQHFSGEVPENLAFCRDEIKALQNIAKLLTLNTQSFTHTRTLLSECWDKLKKGEKERKKERAELKDLFRQNTQTIIDEINTLKQAFEAGLSTQEVNIKIDAIVTLMRRTELGRDEVRELREKLGEIRNQVQEKMAVEEQERNNLELERERLRKEKISQLREQIDILFATAQEDELETITAKREKILAEINQASLAKIDKLELERQLKPLRDLIIEKKDKVLLSLSDDDRQSLLQLNEVLQHRKERRQEIKKQLETYRKLIGSSGLDFEKAIGYNEQINAEKERLDKINEGIEEIESKIAELEGRINE